jgi:1,4-alpha-glucan branching enzyme
MYGLPGKKLVFMGGEFGQRSEWSVDRGLDWWVLDHPNHSGMAAFTKTLNAIYRTEAALYAEDYDQSGMTWVDAGDAASSVLSFMRHGPDGDVLIVTNFTPVVRDGYRVGVDGDRPWDVILNTDAEEFWGTGKGSTGTVVPEAEPMHGRSHSIQVGIPPLGVLFLKREK